jgi:hypothetical protein
MKRSKDKYDITVPPMRIPGTQIDALRFFEMNGLLVWLKQIEEESQHAVAKQTAKSIHDAIAKSQVEPS